MLQRNQKLINAIIAKADQDCPGALAMIGIYGSFLTGDIHEKSDLDLMILINDDRGYTLARTFIQEDLCVGHDLYCTTWEMLENDAKFIHPNIAKLMDSKIVYCSEERHRIRLEKLCNQAMAVDTRQAAEKVFAEAERSFGKAMLAEDITTIRFWGGMMIHQVCGAVALLNNRYFRFGTRRVFEEIENMEQKPENLRDLVDVFISAEFASDLKTGLSNLLRTVSTLFESALPSPEVIPGTYEEMFSNWRNKMYLAAKTNDRYLSFDSMFGLDSMLRELGFPQDVLDKFDPHNLTNTAKAYDEIIENYRKEYERAGIPVQSYPDVDAFIEDYLKKETAF